MVEMVAVVLVMMMMTTMTMLPSTSQIEPKLDATTGNRGPTRPGSVAGNGDQPARAALLSGVIFKASGWGRVRLRLSVGAIHPIDDRVARELYLYDGNWRGEAPPEPQWSASHDTIDVL